ncbi:hypothetical protein K7432_018332 [Basidiobolus ranarum]|uniref:Uncharacterized protein n=1 Tax=Basidiobolus ranarum TaxID=34480 RepID=A0ABR2VJG2_9FUNG
MASSNVQAFAIENPAKELSFAERIKDPSSRHQKPSRVKSNDSISLKMSAGTQLAREILNPPPAGMASAKDQVSALTLATLNDAAPENELLPDCELSLSHDAESLLQFLTSKTQEDMYRMSIYDLYDYASEEEDNGENEKLDFNLDLDLAKMMCNTSSSPSPLFIQSGGLNSLVEDLPKAGLTTCN